MSGMFAVCFFLRGPFDRDMLVQVTEVLRIHDAQAVKSHGRRRKFEHARGSGSNSKAGADLFCSIMLTSKMSTLRIFEDEFGRRA